MAELGPLIRHLVSTRLPPGGRAAFLSPLSPHIALSEPMSSTGKQGSSLGSFPTSPPLYPHFNRPSGFSPCVKSCLVGGSDKYSAGSSLFAFCEAPEPVLDFGQERGSAKGTMADLGPLIRHLVSTRLPPGGRAAFLSPLSPHIALSEPMSSTGKQGSSLGSFPTSPPLYPHFNRPSGFSPCVKSCLVGGSDK